MMKNLLKVATSMLLALSLPSMVTAAPAELKDRYVFTAMEPGSSILVLTTTVTGLAEKYLPKGVKVDINPSGGTVASCTMVDSGRADFGWGEASALWAYEGKILFKKPHTKLRAVAGGMQSAYAQAWMTAAFADKYGIKTFEDIKVKKPPMRLLTKKPGTTGHAVAALQLEAYGVTYSDIKAWGGNIVETGLSEIVDALRDNRGDVWLDNYPSGQSSAVELTQTADVRMLQHTESGLDHMTKYGFTKSRVPAGTWKGQTEETMQPGVMTLLTTSSDVSPEIVYLVVKALSENADTVRKSFAGAALFDEKLAGTPERTIIPLHPGAEKYYREVGYIK
ncbi:C4-dicarboxylate ABC transporter substrate-binding protein [Betaproteobacteria bacterium]|nr:C4-dicarboxylate ABC transporter substrate-binding protein [Betaproteobacteria bacterium]